MLLFSVFLASWPPASNCLQASPVQRLPETCKVGHVSTQQRACLGAVTAYQEGTGVLLGAGRGLLGMVGLPLSGALDLVASLSAGLASSAGISAAPAVRRPAHSLGELLLPAQPA